jgi:hypothetical protein
MVIWIFVLMLGIMTLEIDKKELKGKLKWQKTTTLTSQLS